ncbi:hypothetical protein EJB05_57790, partial [Eragrostis curvula]
MGKEWDWNMCGWVLHTANEDGERGEDDATALPEDCGDSHEVGSSGSEDGGRGPENHDSGLDDRGMSSGDVDDEIVPLGQREPLGQRAVQLLAIRANFPICEIIGFDWRIGRCIYVKREGEVQEEGMVNLVPIGPRKVLVANGEFSLEVYADHEKSSRPIIEEWGVYEDEEIEEYTRTICAGLGRMLEITYLVIPSAIEANVEVKLKLKDLGSRSSAVYGKIKASATDYGNKSVHLFSCERGTSPSFPSGSSSVLPLSPSMVAVPCRWQLELHIEVDLTVITTCDGQEEQDKKLKFSLEFTREIMSQEREVDGDQVEVNIKWYPVN